MKQSAIGTVEWLTTAIFEAWLWVTVGLVAITAFFGRRLVRKWDAVTDSHMPDHIIENKITEIRIEMTECQKKVNAEHTDLANSQRQNQEKLTKAIGEVHTRLDNLYELLLQRRRD